MKCSIQVKQFTEETARGLYTMVDRAECETHGWVFIERDKWMREGICPIGMIEEATDEAVARIEAAKAGHPPKP